MTAPRIAVRAGGVLARFNAEGVLAAADVHVARRLGALTGESDERVLLAVALLVRAVRGGSVCLFLDDRAAMLLPEGEDAPARTESVPTIGPEGPATERVTEPATDLATGLETGMGLPEPGEWLAALAVSPLLASGAVRLVEGRLYLERYWRDETIVRAQIDARLTAGPSDDVDRLRLQAAVRRLFPGEGDDPQRQAATLAARHRLCIVTGGPGTGKTTTVARLVALLQAVAGPGLRVALAAPTGKAAARLAEAVQAEVARMDDADRDRVGPLPAGTVHRLLGWKPGSRSRFAHDRHRHLPYDVVVVDETSMVSLPLMARLLEAIPPTARVVLVGDPDQLASVDAGAVLGDLVAHPRAGALAVVRLEKVHRHGSAIGDLARAVRAGSADDALAMLRAGGGQVSFVEPVAEWLSAQEITAIHGDALSSRRVSRRSEARQYPLLPPKIPKP